VLYCVLSVLCVNLRGVDWSECYKRNEELLPGWSLLSSVAPVALSRLTTRESRNLDVPRPPGS
jgi:hypothetical protein